MTSGTSSSVVNKTQCALFVARLDGFTALTLAYWASTLVGLETVRAHPFARYLGAIDGLVGSGHDEVSIGFLPVHSFPIPILVYHLRLNGHLQITEIFVGHLATFAQLSAVGVHCPPVEALQVAVIVADWAAFSWNFTRLETWRPAE